MEYTKYALKPIYDYKRVIKDLLVYDVKPVGYVVSRCKIKEKYVTYKEDKTEESFKVEFPCGELFMKLPLNSKKDILTVPYVFDDAAEAVIIKNIENKKLRDKRKEPLSYEAKVEEKIRLIEEVICYPDVKEAKKGKAYSYERV